MCTSYFHCMEESKERSQRNSHAPGTLLVGQGSQPSKQLGSEGQGWTVALVELKRENVSERDVDSNSTGGDDCMGLLDVEGRETKVDTLISTKMRADLKVGDYEVKLGTLSLRGG